jgi:hypothetical protein
MLFDASKQSSAKQARCRGITIDCIIILFSLQCKWKWEIVRILQLGSAFGRLLSDLKAPFHSQSRHMAVAAAVKVAHPEVIPAAAPQQRKVLPTDFSEECQKVRGDHGSEAGGADLIVAGGRAVAAKAASSAPKPPPRPLQPHFKRMVGAQSQTIDHAASANGRHKFRIGCAEHRRWLCFRRRCLKPCQRRTKL